MTRHPATGTASVLTIEPGKAPGPARYGSPARATVLAWEDADEFEGLLDALIEEHAPQGPTEHHLVEEITVIMWRARRIGLAEAAVYRAGLTDAIDSEFGRDTRLVRRALSHTGRRSTERAVDALAATTETNAETLAALAEDAAMTRTALQILGAGGPDAYDRALAALHDDSRTSWEETLEERDRTADAAALQTFIEDIVLPFYGERRQEIADQPAIRAQAAGEAFNPSRLRELARYETHLDRKLERLLSMLLKLQEKRAVPGKPAPQGHP